MESILRLRISPPTTVPTRDTFQPKGGLRLMNSSRPFILAAQNYGKSATGAKQAPLMLQSSTPARTISPRCTDLATKAHNVAGAASVPRNVTLGPERAFLADEHVSFRSLGAHPRVESALCSLGLSRPTAVQELGVPKVLTGANVVLAAETGSGKTLSYLIPLVSRILAAKDANMDSGSQATLILCPNTALCNQVAEVANSLINSETGEPLATTVNVSAMASPPAGDVDLLIATPNGLISKLREWSDMSSRWTKDEFPRWIRHLVADEADLLLGGGFIRDLNRLLEVFRLDDRYRLVEALCSRFGMTLEEFENLKYHIRRAGYTDGAEGMLEAEGFEPKTDSGKHVEELGFWKRQYLFVAATMPAGGKGSAAADLRKRYPDAVWLNGDQLHMSKDELEHSWEPVTPVTKKDVLLKVVTTSMECGSSERVLVFVNSVAAADQVAGLLGTIKTEDGERLRVLKYHRDVPSTERQEAIQVMRREGNAVMVCTDSAARGLDIPGVTHVIQAEFATSAVDFIHRAGRTARAGASGRLTSLYTEDDAPLAMAIRHAIESGVVVEKAFSRKRSFRKKIKKYGDSHAIQGAQQPLPA